MRLELRSLEYWDSKAEGGHPCPNKSSLDSFLASPRFGYQHETSSGHLYVKH